MSNEIEMKLICQNEITEVEQLFHSVFTSAPWFDNWNDPTQLHAYISDLMCNRNSLSFGCFEKGKLIAASLGYVMHWCDGTQYYIHEFFVSNDLQGNGVGTSFLRFIEAKICQRDISSIYLETDQNNPAYKFYEKNGFSMIQNHVSLIKTL